MSFLELHTQAQDGVMPLQQIDVVLGELEKTFGYLSYSFGLHDRHNLSLAITPFEKNNTKYFAWILDVSGTTELRKNSIPYFIELGARMAYFFKQQTNLKTNFCI